MRVLCQSLVLAGTASAAVTLHLLSCTLYSTWWPMAVAGAYLLAPLPLCLFARAREGADSLFDDSGGVEALQGWAEFITSTLLTMVVGLPFVLWHANVIELGAAWLSLSGFVLTCSTAGLAMLFARTEDGSSWGGGVALLGS